MGRLRGWGLAAGWVFLAGRGFCAEGMALPPPAHAGIVLESRFAIEEVEVVASPPRTWLSLLPNEGDFARLDHRRIHGARILFRRAPLPEPPADETAAIALYERYVKDLGQGNFVKDMRPPPSLAVGCFGECFILSTGEREPPRTMRVLFVVGKHLYDVRLEVPDRLTGELRKDYHATLASLRIEPLKAPEAASGAPPALTPNAPPP